jgi:RNA polymerase sigma-70 factor, ECF subfamily
VKALHSLTDEELLSLTPKEPEAFDRFYVRHERLVLAYFRRRTASAEVAVDLTAETFVAALASARRFKPGREPAVAWLLGIARHKLLNSISRGPSRGPRAAQARIRAARVRRRRARAR